VTADLFPASAVNPLAVSDEMPETEQYNELPRSKLRGI